MDKLKPCPFCGDEDHVQFVVEDRLGHMPAIVYVKCMNCGVSTLPVNESIDYCAKDEAQKNWNRRACDG